MCITFFILKPNTAANQAIQFVIGFNRDEQTHRKTLPFGQFQQDPNIMAGKDIISGGTWLGINKKTGIFAFLTNYDIDYVRKGKSRGKMLRKFISTDFINEKFSPQQIQQKILVNMNQILLDPQSYAPFNLVVYHPQLSYLYYICTQTGMKQPLALQPNKCYGLCNTDIDTIWPKTEHGLNLFNEFYTNFEGKKQSDMLNQLQKIMQDDKSFNPDPQIEASILVAPYYSQIQKAQRMTKSSFLAIFKNIGGKINIKIRQNTYDSKIKKQVIEYSIYL